MHESPPIEHDERLQCPMFSIDKIRAYPDTVQYGDYSRPLGTLHVKLNLMTGLSDKARLRGIVT
jgi:hypothetical protein